MTWLICINILYTIPQFILILKQHITWSADVCSYEKKNIFKPCSKGINETAWLEELNRNVENSQLYSVSIIGKIPLGLIQNVLFFILEAELSLIVTHCQYLIVL
jgi:hypothetical protein